MLVILAHVFVTVSEALFKIYIMDTKFATLIVLLISRVFEEMVLKTLGRS